MSGPWLRNVFRRVLHADSKIPQNWVKIILSKKEILTLPEDSTGANIHKAQRWKACNSKFLVLLM